MGKKVIIKTKLKNPPLELTYCWREPYEVFPVKGDGTVEGLSIDHPRFIVLQHEWKLEAIEVDIEDEIDKPTDVLDVAKEV